MSRLNLRSALEMAISNPAPSNILRYRNGLWANRPDRYFDANDFVTGGIVSNSQAAAEANTDGIMGAVNAARANGGGRVVVPVKGTVYLGAWDAAVSVINIVAGDEHIWIEGLSRKATILQTVPGLAKGVLGIGGYACALRNLTINGSYDENLIIQPDPVISTAGGFSISGNEHLIENVGVTNVTGYGVSCSQAVSIRHTVFTNLFIWHTGGDAFESKDPLGTNETNFIFNTHIEDFAFRSVEGDKTGFDCSGPWAVSHVSGKDPGADALTCFRFRPRDVNSGGVSSLANFYFKGNSNGTFGGEAIDIGSEFDHVSNGHIATWRVGLLCRPYGDQDGVVDNVTVEDCETGVSGGYQPAQPERPIVLLDNLVIKDCTQRAFYFASSDFIVGKHVVRNCPTTFEFDNANGNTPSRTLVGPGKVFGPCTTALLIDANCNNNQFERVDWSQATGSKTVTDNGTGTIIHNCPGIPSKNYLPLLGGGALSDQVALHGDGVWRAANMQFDYVETVSGQQMTGAPATVGANVANLVKVRVGRKMTVTKMAYGVGAASGNVDLGIFHSTDAGANLTRLGSTGSTAAAGASTTQEINLTAPVTLDPGKDYWFALAADNATVTVARLGAQQVSLGAFQQRSVQKAASFPLPATIAAPTGAAAAVWIAARP